MADTIDLTKYSAGCVTLERYEGEPVDFFKHELLARAGVDMTHQLQTDLEHTRMGINAACDRIPIPFAPTEADFPLISVQQWFDYVDRVKWSPEQYASYRAAESEAKKNGGRVVGNVAVKNQILTSE